jgi:dihydroflavonol-4-reductase
MVLVTGASGLVGLHLIKRLSELKLPVRAIYKTSIPSFLPDTDEQYIEWVAADVLNFSELETAFQQVNYVYHCAAIVSYDKRMLDTMMHINVEGTANVVNLCLLNDVKKMVHVSSIASLGKSDSIITEAAEFDENEVISNYAKSKFEGEMEVWRGIAEGLNAVIVNPAVILGEGNWERSSSNLFKIVYDGFKYYTNGATAWIDVKDVVHAMILLMDSSISNQRFILSSGNYSFKEVFTWMANSMNKKPPYRFASPWMSELVWRLAYVKSILTNKVATITKETAKSAYQISRYSNEKFLTAFPDFQFNDIKNTIERIGKSYT